MNRLHRMENLSAYIDGELTAEEVRLLFAWCESHPEDASEYAALAEVVRQVRELPEVEPPADLQDRILRAVAVREPVEATREQALEWLDEYLDGELSEPRRAVVDHFLQADPEFADLAELHVAMLTSLRALDEAEPPADLKSRIEAQVAAEASRASAPAVARPKRPARPAMPLVARWKVAAVAAALAVAALGIGALRGGSDAPEMAQGSESGAPLATPAEPTVMSPRVVETPGIDSELAPADGPPQVPYDDSQQPVVVVTDLTATDTPAAEEPAPVVPRRTAPATEDVARSDRAPRSEAPRRSTRPAPQPRATRPSGKPQSKPAPSAQPAASPLETAGGSLARQDPSRATRPEGPEFVTGSGNDSVLGGDNLGTEGNLRQGNESPSRGQVDPTRRSEAPPF